MSEVKLVDWLNDQISQGSELSNLFYKLRSQYQVNVSDDSIMQTAVFELTNASENENPSIMEDVHDSVFEENPPEGVKVLYYKPIGNGSPIKIFQQDATIVTVIMSDCAYHVQIVVTE